MRNRLSVSARHSALAFGGWLLLCVGGSAALVVYFIWTMGVAGVIPAAGAIFGAFVAWFPTHGNAYGRSLAFQHWCLFLVLLMGCVSAFSGATAGQLLFEYVVRADSHQRNLIRAKEITEASVKARQGGLRSRDAARVSEQTAALLKQDAAGDLAPLAADEDGPWMRDFKRKYIRYIEWLNGLLGMVVMAVLFALYREDEDQQGKLVQVARTEKPPDLARDEPEADAGKAPHHRKTPGWWELLKRRKRSA